MTNKLTRLELTWPGKENRFNPEPRILVEDKEKSYSKEASPDSKVEPTFDNMLIHGDNLLALKALEQDYTGKIKCIYIDPPYNTGNAFTTYEDGLEHSIWLSLIRDRLELLQKLLSDDGLIAIQIDHSPNNNGNSPELGYLQVLCDEIFGRRNYITNIVWKKKGNASNTTTTIGTITESIFVYAKDKRKAIIYKEEFEKTYKYEDEKGQYNLETFIKTDQGAYNRETMKFDIVDPNTGDVYSPPFGKRWTYGKQTIDEMLKYDMLVFEKGRVYAKKYKADETTKLFKNLLLEHGSLKSAKAELEALGFSRESFETPKPESLIREILSMFSKPGDLVLDSFLGSGTTCAVAHKMGRRWIGIEMGDHCYTHCLPRLKKVINGEDTGGVTKSTGWLCGGGFKFYELASSLIIKDKHGQQIISDKYNADMLAEAMCKILGYHYKPDPEKYWKQGYSSEKNFIYTTTNNIQEASLASLSKEIGDDNLLICCSAFMGNTKAYPNITIKKIPSAILKKCEWGAVSYPLPVREDFSDEDFEFDEEE